MSLIARLRKGKQKRSQFVDSHLAKGIAYQIRATRDRLDWSQERLAKETGMPQNAISRLESPEYGKPTLTTLKRIAAAFDVALVVRFVPFTELIDWVSGTPRTNPGLSSTSLGALSFDAEDRAGEFDERQPKPMPDTAPCAEILMASADVVPINAGLSAEMTNLPPRKPVSSASASITNVKSIMTPLQAS